jgi:hypothetical protein
VATRLYEIQALSLSTTPFWEPEVSKGTHRTSYAHYASCTSFQIPDYLLEIFSNFLFKEKTKKQKYTTDFIFNSAHAPAEAA